MRQKGNVRVAAAYRSCGLGVSWRKRRPGPSQFCGYTWAQAATSDCVLRQANIGSRYAVAQTVRVRCCDKAEKQHVRPRHVGGLVVFAGPRGALSDRIAQHILEKAVWRREGSIQHIVPSLPCTPGAQTGAALTLSARRESPRRSVYKRQRRLNEQT